MTRHRCIHWALASLVCVIALSCADNNDERARRLFRMVEPDKSFAETEPPAPPDYANPEHWGCLPDRDGDPCDQVPKGSDMTDGQAGVEVDCFCIYPTTYYRGYGWNARLDDRVTKYITDRGPLRTQFSVYNGSCRVFAPYFRQAGLAAFGRPHGHPDQAGALKLATGDVLASFQYYLDHYDKGRPIIIAGHSQGIRHAINLLKEYFEGKELHKRLVAAYLIGGNLHKGSLTKIQTCDSPTQTGCALGWRTMEWGFQTNRVGDEKPGIKMICVNPLSWKNDEQFVDASKNLGGVRSNFKTIDPGITGAKCDGDNLWIKPTPPRGYPTLGRHNYHLCDYSLFYLNIRENVEDRIEAFTRNK